MHTFVLDRQRSKWRTTPQRTRWHGLAMFETIVRTEAYRRPLLFLLLLLYLLRPLLFCCLFFSPCIRSTISLLSHRSFSFSCFCWGPQIENCGSCFRYRDQRQIVCRRVERIFIFLRTRMPKNWNKIFDWTCGFVQSKHFRTWSRQRRDSSCCFAFQEHG